MKAWLKGGLIGLALILVYNFFDIYFKIRVDTLATYLTELLIGCDLGIKSCFARGLLLLFFIHFLIWVGAFFIGALIGWIIGKFRNR
jgi:hypothetical protein